VIRPGGPADARAVRAVHEAAFPAGAEADLVDALDAAGDTVLSLVADEEGAIAGHILLSRMRAEGDGCAIRALGLAPVAVMPERQGEGIGARLIWTALMQARLLEEDMVFVLGDPGYYERFGFSAETAAPFASPYAGPHFMALSLCDGFIPPAAGTASYAPAFAEVG